MVDQLTAGVAAFSERVHKMIECIHQTLSTVLNPKLINNCLLHNTLGKRERVNKLQ